MVNPFKSPFLTTTAGRFVERLVFVAVAAVLSDVLTHVTPGQSTKYGAVYVVIKTAYDYVNNHTPNQ